uniref:Uncharacterized protein n=1 Tax=Rhizophora mucronata TaxID=61149 RepID=A0A2P2PWC3_RHIMU
MSDSVICQAALLSLYIFHAVWLSIVLCLLIPLLTFLFWVLYLNLKSNSTVHICCHSSLLFCKVLNSWIAMQLFKLHMKGKKIRRRI